MSPVITVQKIQFSTIKWQGFSLSVNFISEQNDNKTQAGAFGGTVD